MGGQHTFVTYNRFSRSLANLAMLPLAYTRSCEDQRIIVMELGEEKMHKEIATLRRMNRSFTS
jgi:hypothetical protein